MSENPPNQYATDMRTWRDSRLLSLATFSSSSALSAAFLGSSALSCSRNHQDPPWLHLIELEGVPTDAPRSCAIFWKNRPKVVEIEDMITQIIATAVAAEVSASAGAPAPPAVTFVQLAAIFPAVYAGCFGWV